MAVQEADQIESVEHLLGLSYHDQLRWAADQDSPWDGVTMPQTKIVRGQVEVVAGNVTRMPNLGGRPCFGNPVAWAVHGVVRYRYGEFGPVMTRCGRCQARFGCERVSESRLTATPDISTATVEFRAAWEKRKLPSAQRPRAKHALEGLIRELVKYGPFECSNDQYALSWIVQQRRGLGAYNDPTLHKSDNTRADSLSLHLHPEMAEHLLYERNYRAARYLTFRDSDGAPKAVTVDPTGENADFTADVWLARERLTLSGSSTSRHSIAAEMQALKRDYGLNTSALASRIMKAIRRIALLEYWTVADSSETVWPKYDASVDAV